VLIKRLDPGDGGQRGGDPDSADACPPDDVVDWGRVCRGLVRGRGRARGGRPGFRLLAAMSWTAPPIKLYRIYLPRLLRLNGAPGGRWRGAGLGFAGSVAGGGRGPVRHGGCGARESGVW